jgi:hypothetical protein
MPLPLAPLLPFAMRLGVIAATGYAVKRFIAARSFPGRTDQRVEDAFDELGEGISTHQPADRIADQAGDRQTNATVRVRRVIRFRGKTWELDAGLMARLRLLQRKE